MSKLHSSPLPPYSWKHFNPTPPLRYIRDLHEANTLLESISSSNIFGFDLEWKPTFTRNTPENPVALVQLANDQIVLLIQVSAMPEFPSRLRELLENPSITKAGVGIQNDARKLWKDWGVSIRNCVDLALLARSVDNNRWKGKYSQPLGLARLVETYLDCELGKGKITRSNWESELSIHQQEYAANDAHSGHTLYCRFRSLLHDMTPPPNSVCFTFHAMEGQLCDRSGLRWTPFNPDYDPGPPPPPRPIPVGPDDSSPSEYHSARYYPIPSLANQERIRHSNPPNVNVGQSSRRHGNAQSSSQAASRADRPPRHSNYNGANQNSRRNTGRSRPHLEAPSSVSPGGYDEYDQSYYTSSSMPSQTTNWSSSPPDFDSEYNLYDATDWFAPG